MGFAAKTIKIHGRTSVRKKRFHLQQPRCFSPKSNGAQVFPTDYPPQGPSQVRLRLTNAELGLTTRKTRPRAHIEHKSGWLRGTTATPRELMRLAAKITRRRVAAGTQVLFFWPLCLLRLPQKDKVVVKICSPAAKPLLKAKLSKGLSEDADTAADDAAPPSPGFPAQNTPKRANSARATGSNRSPVTAPHPPPNAEPRAILRLRTAAPRWVALKRIPRKPLKRLQGFWDALCHGSRRSRARGCKIRLGPGSGSDAGVCRLTLDAERTRRVRRRAVLAPGPAGTVRGGTGGAGAAAVRTKEAERRDYFKGFAIFKSCFSCFPS